MPDFTIPEARDWTRLPQNRSSVDSPGYAAGNRPVRTLAPTIYCPTPAQVEECVREQMQGKAP